MARRPSATGLSRVRPRRVAWTGSKPVSTTTVRRSSQIALNAVRIHGVVKDTPVITVRPNSASVETTPAAGALEA